MSDEIHLVCDDCGQLKYACTCGKPAAPSELAPVRLLDAEFMALIKQWRAIRDRQQSARAIIIGDTYEDAENFITAMERIESHARGLGI